MDTSSGQSSGSSTGLAEAVAWRLLTQDGPNELPHKPPRSVWLIFFMAMGAWRISKHQVLTRQSATIETLGSATVLCTDKTGTLTMNRMALAELRMFGRQAQIGKPRHPFCLSCTNCWNTPYWPVKAARPTRWSGPSWNWAGSICKEQSACTLSPSVLGLTFASGLLSYVLVLLVRRCKIFKAT